MFTHAEIQENACHGVICSDNMPLRETANQAYTFLLFLYAGVFCSVVFDILTPIRRMHRILHLLADIIICFLCIFILAFIFHLAHEDTLRLYMLLAYATGAAMYHAGIRTFFTELTKFFCPDRKSTDRGE